MLVSLFVVLLVINLIYGEDYPKVDLKQGTVMGIYEKSRKGRTYAAYKGIPYAKAPIGGLRFQDPFDPPIWDGVWNATEFSDICPQVVEVHKPGQTRIQGNEDCLYLNVYAPLMKTQEKKVDVIVFIHGGGFMWGSGNQYSAVNIMDRRLIFVTLNYRLNIFGFLSTEDAVLPGNLGLKDQSTALRWIKNNIAAFGGNCDSVTITGLSAGGASVHYHYLSQLSKGLFSRGISFSGSSLCPWAQTEGANERSKQLALQVGCPITNSKMMVDCLRTRPALQLVNQIESFQIFMNSPFTPFGPVVDKEAWKPFIEDSPVKLLKAGKVADLPWVTGVTTDAGLYPIADLVRNSSMFEEYNKRFTEYAPYVFDYHMTVPQNLHKKVAQQIRDHYVGNKPFSRNILKKIIKMVTDRIFVVDVERTARLHSSINSAPVYFYEFAYKGEHSFGDVVGNLKTNIGVCHGDDVIFVIPFFEGQNPPMTQQDKDMIERLLDFWASYATTGSPIFRGLEWKAVQPTQTNYLRIEGPNEYFMSKSNDLGNRKFWDSLPIDEPQRDIMPTVEHSEL